MPITDTPAWLPGCKVRGVESNYREGNWQRSGRPHPSVSKKDNCCNREVRSLAKQVGEGLLENVSSEMTGEEPAKNYEE